MEQEKDDRPLDILKHFIFNNTEYKVAILWEDGQPLFRATDIGNVLGIKDVHTSIRDFDEDEKTLRTMPTIYLGTREHLFLTEVGVYRVLFQSRKPIAKPFQKWVARVIRDIQRNGKYEVENLREELERAYARVAEVEEKSEVAIERAARRAKHEALLFAHHNKHIVYFGRIGEVNGKHLIKVGATKDVWTTFTERHPRDYGEIELIHAVECQSNKQFEHFLLHHKNIRPLLYQEPVKLDGGKSIEVICVDDEEFQGVLRIVKTHVRKYRAALNDVQVDLQEIKDLIMGMMEAKESEMVAVDPPQQKKKRLRPKREKGPGICPGCDAEITKRAQLCPSCERKTRPKKFEISKEVLYDLVHVQKKPFTAIGKEYGVSDNAIRKRCKRLGIEIRKR